MRCKNCGWDNPAGNTKCEKCNAPLSGSMVDSRDLHETKDTFQDDVNLKKTAQGCPKCGYPLKPSDEICPNCDYILRGSAGNDPIVGQPKQKVIGGTIIGGGIIENGSDDNRKKLVGFLVTYSLDLNGIYFPLYEGRNFIGRDSASSICIPGDDKISGKHFSILYRAVDKKFKYRDEQSSNGTFINEELSDEGELSNNDIIRIGSTQLIFIIIPQK